MTPLARFACVSLVSFGLLGAVVTPAVAQDLPVCRTPAQSVQDHWCPIVVQIIAAARDETTQTSRLGAQGRIEQLVRINGKIREFMVYAQARNKSIDLRLVEDARTDKQVAAPGGPTGSTSAVSKGSVPGILGFAVENGALTQSSAGSKVTLRGNLVGWLDLVQNQGFIESYQDDSRFVRALRRVSYSFTLNTDTGSTTEPAEEDDGGFNLDAIKEEFRQTRQQLDNYSVRVAILDRRDPRSLANRDIAMAALGPHMEKVLLSDNFLSPLVNSQWYNFRWIPETASSLNDPSLTYQQAEKILFQQLDLLHARLVETVDNFDEQVANSLLAVDGYDEARKRTFEAISKRPLVAFEYVNAREKDLPDKSTLRFIAEGQFGERFDVTANVAWTLQRQAQIQLPEPATLERLRDFQAAAQVDIPMTSLAKRLSSAGGIGPPVLAVAYLSQKLTKSAAISFAGHEFTVEPGWIHAIQAKVTVPVKGSGVKVPLSITYANRDELIKEKTVRGQVGLTFDLDVLSSAIRR